MHERCMFMKSIDGFKPFVHESDSHLANFFYLCVQNFNQLTLLKSYNKFDCRTIANTRALRQ